MRGSLVVLSLMVALVRAQSDFRTIYICDAQPVAIDCPSGSTIDVGTSIYGRSSRSICAQGNTNVGACSKDVTAFVKSTCQGKEDCKFTVKPASMGVADPCVNVFKYLSLNYRCVAGAVGVVKKCTVENPSSWGLRFRLTGTAVTPSGCRTKCVAGGGNGEFCINAPLGWCVCGTDRQPESTSAPTQGCTTMCPSTNSECGGTLGQYSCYGKPLPPPAAATCDIGTFVAKTSWECQASGDPHWYASNWPAFRHWMLQGRYLMLGQSRGKYSAQLWGTFVVCNKIGSWSATCIHNMYLTLATPTTGPVTVTFDAATSAGKPFLNGKLLALPAYDFYGACIWSPASATFYGRGGSPVAIPNAIIVRWFETTLLLGFQPSAAFGTIGLFQWWFPNNTAKNPPNVEGVCSAFVHPELERFEPSAKEACEQLDVYIKANGGVRNKDAIWNMANTCCKDFTCDPGAWKGCVIDACLAGACTSNNEQKAWTINAACSGKCVGKVCDSSAQCSSCKCDQDTGLCTDCFMFPAGMQCNDGDAGTVLDNCDGNGKCIGRKADCQQFEECTLCSKTCGTGGTQTCKRSIISPAVGSGAPCGAAGDYTKPCAALPACGCTGTAPLPANAASYSVACTNIQEGGSCAQKCLAGYSPATSTVCKSGQYVLGVCEAASCQVPALPANGVSWGCAGALANGQSCQLTCAGGFTASGRLSCNLGQLSQVQCLSIGCGMLQPLANGQWVAPCSSTSKDPVKVGQTCTPKCDVGYYYTGQPAVCQEGNVWSANVQQIVCGAIPCLEAPPAIEQVIWAWVGSRVETDSRIGYKCVSGYVAQDPNAGALCKNGRWKVDASVKCVAASCKAGPVAPTKGSYPPCLNQPHNSECVLTCTDGYKKTDDATCVRGVWTQPTCVLAVAGSCDATNKPAPPANGQWDSCAIVLPNQACAVRCAAGYVPRGGLWCKNGQLTSDAGCDADSCYNSPPAVANGGWGNCGRAPHGGVCTPTCTACYQPSGNATCKLGGWTLNNAACTPSPCAWMAGMIANGVTNCANGNVGTSCTVTCNAGYRLVGGLTCNACGWSQAQCVPMGCAAAPVTANGKFPGCTNVAHGGQCGVECVSGFMLSGPATAKCNLGQWSAPLPQCVPAGCSTLPVPNPANGEYPTTCNNADNGETCIANCKPGYQPASNAVCTNGQWSGATVCAETPCGTPPAVVNGNRTICPTDANGKTPSGSACAIACYDKYVLNGELRCTRGVWSIATCNAPLCRKQLQIPQGTFPIACSINAAHGVKCQATCAAGFTLNDGPAICTYGEWLNVPQCRPSPCTSQPPAIAYGSWVWKGAVESGATIGYTCKEGYRALVTAGQAECYQGKWNVDESVVVCVPLACANPPAAPTNGKAYPKTCVNVPHGQYCTLACNPGYVKTDDAKCIEGKWTEPACIQDPNGCQGPPKPDPTNGKYDPCLLVPDAGTCLVQCDKGYIPKQHAKCSKAQWSQMGICQETGCQSVNIELPFGSFPKTCAGANPGDQCVPKCVDGYEPVGFAVCRAGSFVLNGARCAPKSCPALPPVRVGAQSVNCQAPVADGAACAVTCKTGYRIIGNATCNRGVWTDYECQAFACAAPPAIQFGSADTTCKNVDGNGGKCSVTCNAGYEFANITATAAICNLGVWWTPTCQEKGCKRPPVTAVPYGQWTDSCAPAKDGAKCAPQCLPKHVVVGSAVCDKGQWDTDDAACQPQPCAALPVVANGVVSGCAAPVASGKQCQLACNKNFEPSGQTVCQLGAWTVGQCLPAKCPVLPAVEFGVWDAGCTTDDGEMCQVTCNKGYTVSGGPAKCGQAQWWNVPKCVEVGCTAAPTVAIENGRWVWAGPVAPGAKLNYECATGYSQQNVTAFAVCRRGSFDYDLSQIKCVPARCMNQPNDAILGGNGTFAQGCAPAKHGSECAVNCIANYEKTANAKCEFGVWSRPQCIRSTANDCQGPPAPVQNGKWQTCQGIQEGRQCVLDCSRGYTKSGDAVCQAAKYIAPLPTCKPNPCAEQPGPDPKNGVFSKTCAGKNHGFECEPTCSAGFDASGSAVCRFGTWDLSSASCVASPCKGAIPTLANGTVDCGTVGPAGVPHGAACKATCKVGFELDGEIRCRNGQYTLADCDPLPCLKAPTVTNGRYGANCANIPNGGSCQVWCDDGYVADRPAAWCSLGQFAAPLPQCLPKTCPVAPAKVASGSFAANCVGAAHNTSCVLTCDAGFIKTGDAICRKGQWDLSAAVCYAAPCNQPPTNVVANANVTCALGADGKVQSGVLCTVACADGYELNGQLRCTRGQWSTATCTPKACLTPPPVLYGTWPATCTNIPDQGLCTATCNKGYVAAGATVQCEAGQWNDTALCAPADCTGPLPSFPRLRWKNTQGRYKDGDVIYYACDVGYVAYNTSAYAACIKGEYQIDAVQVQCLPAPCNTEPTVPITNGTYQTQCKGTAHLGKCGVICVPGFDKTADAECTYGQWTVPRCIRNTVNDCKTPPAAAANGKWICTATENGKVCPLECADGYDKTGDAKCTNAQYVNPLPTCQPESCDDLPQPNPNFGTYPTSCVNVAHGSACRAQCRAGYIPQGSALCKLGNWDLSASSCIPAPCGDAPPTIEFATQQCPTSPVAHGAGCTVTCNAGYRLEGQVMCTQGTWSRARCLPLACNDFPRLANGDVVPECKKSPTSGSGGTCAAICNEYYQLKAPGATAFVCRAGSWDQASIPQCVPIPCQGQPPRVEFGTWTCTGTSSSDTCTLGCTGQYNASLASVVCARGHWQNSASARCNPKGCLAQPGNPANGTYATCANSPHGAICALTCTGRNVKSGDSVCRYGVWSTNQCVAPLPNDCTGKPTDIQFGEFDDCQDVPHQGKCILNCDEGYQKNGDALCNDGTYTNLATLKCTPMACAAIPAGPSKTPGSWACTAPQASGANCNLNCPVGYAPSGAALCKAGKWANADAYCVPKSCVGNPQAVNNGGSWLGNCTNVPHRGTCSPSCPAGFTASGLARCTLGIWENGATCNPNPCSTLPPVMNAVAGKDCGKVASGASCSSTCLDGYQPVNGSLSWCANGVWTVVAQCSESPCLQAPQPVPKGTWSCQGKQTAPGTNCTLTCGTGYQTSQPNALCSRGLWVGVPTCDPAGCTTAPPAPANGAWANATACAGADHGDVCSLACNTDYVKSADAECEFGVWSVVECHKEKDDDCKGAPSPNPLNGRFEGCVDVASNGTCKLLCDVGYASQGDAKCFDGFYDVSGAICKPLGCPVAPPAVRNGQFPGACNNVNHGAVCNLQCNGVYNKTGDAVCLRGKWDMTNALCMPPTCTPPVDVPFGTFPTCPGRTKHLEECELVCQRPYIKSGDAQCVMGEWRMPRCIEAPCAATPVQPKNGKYSTNCTNVASGEECTLWCDAGYTATGDAKCRNGTWSGDVSNGAPLPTCMPNGCAQPPVNSVANGQWDCSGASDHNDKCELDCNDGYVATGDALCWTGKWTNVDRRCDPASCKVEPSPPAYGKFEADCADTPHGASCQLMCDPGFWATAAAVCKLGVWSNPSCQVKPCAQAPAIQNGYFVATCKDVSGNNGTCQAGCNTGYVLSNVNATCYRGQWVAAPTCSEQPCTGQPVARPQATWACTNMTSGAWCSPQCATGYEVIGNGAQCVRGNWMLAAAVCQPKKCATAPTDPANGSHNNAARCANSPDNSWCTVVCNAGYLKTKDSVCRHGVWTVGECIQEKNDDCRGRPVPNPLNGQYDTCLETADGGSCDLNCVDGFVSAGPARCNKAVWTLSTCTEKPCVPQPPTGIAGGSFFNCSGTASGSTCGLKCEGVMQAQGQAVCVRGAWDLSGARCVHPPCTTAPKVQFGSFANCAGVKAHGYVCDLTCVAPYVAVGQAQCFDGIWRLPTCAPPKCKSGPINPANGQFSGTCEGVENGTLCSLTCQEGYQKTGDAWCLVGQWRGGANEAPLPVCQPRGCAQPPTNDIDNGDWDCTGKSDHGDACVLDCDSGYVATGSASCFAGNWINTDRKCVPKPCPGSPVAPARGTFAADCVDEPHGGSCVLTCQVGYTASASAVCQYGVYSTVTCVEKKCVSPPLVSNGEASANCLQGNCEILCKNGYGIAGADRLARCVAGVWAFVPDCVPLPCGTAPNPVPNGQFSCRKGEHLDACQLVCSKGYTKTTDSICRFGQWTGQASCEPMGCAYLPELDYNSTIKVEECRNKRSGESCPLYCDPGFVKDSDFVCHAGRWSRPKCHPKKKNDCIAPPNPNPANGQYDACVDVSDAGICELECAKGFTKTGDAVCNNGTWGLAACTPNPCLAPPTAVPRGKFAECVNIASGQPCNLQCDQGTVKRGDAVCLNGLWDVSDAACDFPSCAALPAIVRGVVVNCTGVQPHGTACAVKCDGGWRPDGQAVCVAGTYRVPRCLPPPCIGLPDEPKNGKYGVKCANAADEFICPLECQSGFAATGSAQCNEGQWSGIDGDVMPYCEPKGCAAAPQVRVENGRWDCKRGVGSGDACTLVCNAGFLKSGDAICVGDAWLQTAQKCSPRPCLSSPANPPNGQYSAKDCVNVQDGGVCKLWCNEGYAAAGDAICRGGQWSLPACAPKPCIHPPPVQNGEVDATCKQVSGDSGKCSVKCDEGYGIETADSNAVCQAGNWTSVPVCEPQDCNAPPNAVPRGKWQCTSAPHLGTCALQCQSGYEESGSAVCSAGRWSGAASCVEDGCDTPPSPVLNGTFAANCAPTQPGGVCVLTCAAGAVKSEDARCIAGEWTDAYCHWPEPNDCIAPPNPDPMNGDFDNCTDVESGKECRLTCASGYVPTANAMCNNGTWILSQCLPQNCTGLPRVSQGYFATPCPNAPHGQSCLLTCDVGFEKLGDPTCRLGQWDYTNATCIEQRCSSLPAIDNGQVNNCQLPVSSGQACNVTCNAGFDAEEDEADCVRGQWRAPDCVAYCADSPSNPANGTYAKCDGEHDGEACDLACAVGFTKTGDAICRAGQWVHINTEIKEMPRCVPLGCKAPPAMVQNGTWSQSCANGAASGAICVMTCTGGYKKSSDGVCSFGSWNVVTCTLDDPCATVRCAPAQANNTCYTTRCNKGTGQCETIPQPKGTVCNDNNNSTFGDSCDGVGNCYGYPDLCEEVECPYAMTQCQNDGTCDPKTGECVSTYKTRGTPCDDGSAATINDQCDGQGNCAGRKETGGLPYVGAYGKWGWTCCLVMTMVMDGPVAAIQLTATSDIVDLSAYSLDIASSVPGQPDLDVTLPAGPMKAGSSFTVTNNMTRFISFFNNQPQNYSEGLPDLTGKEMIRLLRTPAGAGDDYLIDYFPPTNDSTTYDWQNGLAYRTVFDSWKLQTDVFTLNQTLTMPWGSFQLFGNFNAACACQRAKADTISNGKPMCRTAASSFPTADFQDSALNPTDDFGPAWHFIAPGLIEAMDGKWLCTVTA